MLSNGICIWLRLVLIIVIIVVVFKGIKFFNEKIESNILNDIKDHFEAKGFMIKKISPILKNSQEIPFNVNEWSPSTGMEGKDYYANRFWKVELIDNNKTETIKWINTGHLFFYQMYFIVKPNEDKEQKTSA